MHLRSHWNFWKFTVFTVLAAVSSSQVQCRPQACDLAVVPEHPTLHYSRLVVRRTSGCPF
jgi:hypothetical protein